MLAHVRPSIQEIEAAVSQMPLLDLVDLIGVAPLSQAAWPQSFWCPRHQLAARDRIPTGPAAKVIIDPFDDENTVNRWACVRCGIEGNRASLARTIIENADFMAQLRQHLQSSEAA